ncbi:MAG: IS30 family transposase [Desulfobacteraceae bacterium]|nr:IS30 family transposase [Desulfobacteraceae bacterium]
MKHITQEQRYTICVMKKQGYKQKDIAFAIGKNKSVISRELNRNSDKRSNEYKSDLAQRKYVQRQKSKPKKIRFTQTVQQLVNDWLAEDYSPEQIVGRAKFEGRECVSHEHIYQYVWYNKKHEKGILYEHLRHKGRKYRKRGAAKDSRGCIKNRVDISLRPAIVDKKERLGDLEIDTVIGQNHKGAILTINDRVSSFVWIEKLQGKDAKDLAKKAIEKLTPCNQWIQTITADNGKEFAEHEAMAKDLEINFFFARAYHSWERGANENTNGLIRQYFPKGSSFKNITNQQIQDVQHKLNNRPRKKLNFLTPNEFLTLNLSNQKVAFVT